MRLIRNASLMYLGYFDFDTTTSSDVMYAMYDLIVHCCVHINHFAALKWADHEMWWKATQGQGEIIVENVEREHYKTWSLEEGW